MASSGRLAVLLLPLLLLAAPTWAQPASNTAAPPAASFPVDPPPQPNPAPVPPAPPPPPGAVSPASEVPPAAPPPPAAAPAPAAPPAPPPTSAESSVDGESPRHEPQYLDYRLQLVASDAVALGLAITAASLQIEELGYASLGVYALGAPVVHGANGQPLRGLASAGMRVGFPIGGFFVGIVAALPVCASASGEYDCLGAMAVFAALGVVGGGLTAVIIDDGFFGKVEIKEPASEAALRRGHGVRAALVPVLDPHRKALGASLVGSF